MIMLQFVGMDPNPRTWRQMATGISREYILLHLLEEGQTTSTDIAMKHGSPLSRTHYARDGNVIPRLTTDTICEQRAAGQAWHDVLGIGANSPPLPVQL